MPPRATSPISFTRHSPSARAADISRLLDPSYSSNAYASTSAYVDRHGELHDPDYRHFPIAQPSSKRHSPHSHAYSMATRPRWELIDEDAVDDEDEEEDMGRNSIIGRRHPHSSSFSSYQQQRPYAYTTPTYKPLHHQHIPRSFDSDETVLDEYDEQDASGDEDSKGNGVSRMILRTKREFTRKRRSLDGASRKSIDSYSPTFLDSPFTTTTAVSAEPEPEDAASMHYAPSHHHPLTYTLSHQSYSRRSQHSRASFHSEGAQPLNIPSSSSESRPHSHSASSHTPADVFASSQDDEHEPVWTPTCAQALRRQWQAVSLRVRFGVFRAQRRMKTRLAQL
ncbi:hypothetical protein FPV67DRAFT_1457874 [Lyophyllum atratum]|nr:hypothetical protein FPV67DRAFT_1457874 [Lyophyllum atratum]